MCIETFGFAQSIFPISNPLDKNELSDLVSR